MKKASTFPASEWCKIHARTMSVQTASKLCRNGKVKGATKDYLGKWLVPKNAPDPRLPPHRPSLADLKAKGQERTV